MSKVKIAPIEVIKTTDFAGKPANTEIVKIVEIDRERNLCWDSTNIQYQLSDVETWARPQSDVWNTPLNINVSTVAADGSTFSETLVPQKPTMPQQAQSKQPQHESVQENEEHISKIPALQEETKVPQVEQPQNEIEVLINRFLKTNSYKVEKSISLECTANFDINKLLDIVNALSYNKEEILHYLIGKKLLKIE